jgi:hypothetical protein
MNLFARILEDDGQDWYKGYVVTLSIITKMVDGTYFLPHLRSGLEILY